MEDTEQIIAKLNKDLKKLATTMDINEVRFLVDNYYQMQENRLRSEGQIRSIKEEPHAVLEWLADNSSALEKQIALALGCFADSTAIGQWAGQTCGVGPIINAGLQAYLDITKAETAGAIWNLMGYNPQMRWLGTAGADTLVRVTLGENKWNAEIHIPMLAKAAGMKVDTLTRMAQFNGAKLTRDNVRKALARRPWNANLKTLAFNLGESFVKVSTNPKSLYGRLFKEQRAKYIERNVSGANAAKAQSDLASDKMKRLGRDTDCRKWLEGWFKPTGVVIETRYAAQEGKKAKKAIYFRNGVEFVPDKNKEAVAAGWLYLNVGVGNGGVQMLPPAQIHAMARRWVVKIFISHWHQAAYRLHFHKDPPNPFAIAHRGHTHFIEPEVKFPEIEPIE